MKQAFVNFYQNVLAVKSFYQTKGNCKVIFFNVPSEVLFAYLDYDVIKEVSNRIDQAKELDLETIDRTLYKQTDTLEFLRIRKILKLAWLIVHLKNNKVKNPVQLLKSGDKYFCHPGTDRVLISTYLRPTNTVKGIYLWHPELDPTPFILDYEHKEITNYIKFLTLFSYNKTFKIKSGIMSDDLDVADKDDVSISNAMFSTAKATFERTSKTFRVPFLTFHDNSQWNDVEKLKFKDLINFKSDNECVFGNLTFVKINGVWILND